MRIFIRTSKWAIWARRLSSIAVPLVVIPIFMHRLRLLNSTNFMSVAEVAGAVVLLALLLSVVALAHLWQSGDQGWGRAISALLLALVCLVPFAYVGVQMLRYPAVTDIATTDRSALPLMFDPDMLNMPPPKMLDAAQLEKTYPNVKIRSYPLNQAQTFQLVSKLVDGEGWDVQRTIEPDADGSAGLINAQIVTLLGWREDVAIAVTGDEQSAVVNMRSASVNATHDLGSNGKRIEAFLATLDDQITDLLRDNPNANQPADPDAPVADSPAEPATPAAN